MEVSIKANQLILIGTKELLLIINKCQLKKQNKPKMNISLNIKMGHHIEGKSQKTKEMEKAFYY